MIDVILYGDIGRTYGKYHKYLVKSTQEALRALEANFPGFMSCIKKDGFYKVIVDKKPVDEENLLKIASNSIKIIPVVQGSGKGIGQVIAGVALMALAWWNPMGWGIIANSEAGLIAGELGISAMQSVGMSLLLGGVSQMLTKTPSVQSGSDRPDTNPSYMFNGPVNTTAQGNPVPLAYGKILAGSQVISTGLEAR